jgi:hypothetical protein
LFAARPGDCATQSGDPVNVALQCLSPPGKMPPCVIPARILSRCSCEDARGPAAGAGIAASQGLSVEGKALMAKQDVQDPVLAAIHRVTDRIEKRLDKIERFLRESDDAPR